MRRASALASLALVASMSLASPSRAAPAKSQGDSAKGSITIEGLTLAGSQFGTPSGQPTTMATDPVSLPLRKGDSFTYSTITCASPFPPWNSFGLHFDPDYPGITDPASVRHEIRGTVAQVKPSGRGRIEGTISTYLCVGGARADQLVIAYKAKFEPTAATQVPLTGGGPVPTTGGLAVDGRFKVVEGTGRFEGLSSHGTMAAQLTCVPGTLMRNNTTSCASLGGFSEAPFRLEGWYRDPTVPAT
jgi:hypothetical protein